MADGEGKTITIPGAGPVKKQWVYIGGSVVAGILVYAYWRRAHNNAASSSIVDPNAYTPPALPSDATTTAGLTPQQQPAQDTGLLPPTTNAEWSRRAIDYMQGLGTDPQLLAAVLGKYLAHLPLTAAEADLVRVVQGVQGPPPVGDNRIIVIGTPPSPDPTPTPAPAPSPAPAPAPAVWHPPATIRRGSRGDLVRQAQASLRGHGFDPGPIDGIFGPRTDAATRAFQRSRHLVVDGIIGPKTWTALHG